MTEKEVEKKQAVPWLSASQITTYNMCPRKWFFKSRLKLPTIRKDHFIFGSTLHAVVERWLRADDVGKDEHGSPVELYPEGWAEGVDPADKALIKILVRAAIEEGVIERWPQRKIEHEFSRDFDKFIITGFVDVLLPDMVVDHKTTKNMRYALSEARLKKDLQMMVYAGELIMRADNRKTPRPEVITLRHNVFLKDIRKTMIRKTEALVGPEYVEDYWDREIIPRCQEMTVVADQFGEEDWQGIPLPPDINEACNAYGGCPFMSICHRGESIKDFKDRIDRVGKREVKSQVTNQVNHSQGDESMSIMGKSKRIAAMKATAESKQEKVETEKKEAVAQNAPPWAQDGCRACNGTGFNSRGNPCFVCDHASKEAGGPVAADYDVKVEGENFTWTAKDGAPAPEEGSTPVAEDPDQVANVATEVTDTPPLDSTGDIPDAAVAPAELGPNDSELDDNVPDDPDSSAPVEGDLEDATEEEVAEAQAEEKKRKYTRQKKSFTLMVNCAFARGNQKVMYLDKVLKDFGDQLADELGKDSYYEIDAFKRRDIMCSKVGVIAESLGTAWVIANGESPDSRALLDALKPFATSIVEGTR